MNKQRREGLANSSRSVIYGVEKNHRLHNLRKRTGKKVYSDAMRYSYKHCRKLAENKAASRRKQSSSSDEEFYSCNAETTEIFKYRKRKSLEIHDNTGYQFPTTKRSVTSTVRASKNVRFNLNNNSIASPINSSQEIINFMLLNDPVCYGCLVRSMSVSSKHRSQQTRYMLKRLNTKIKFSIPQVIQKKPVKKLNYFRLGLDAHLARKKKRKLGEELKAICDQVYEKMSVERLNDHKIVRHLTHDSAEYQKEEKRVVVRQRRKSIENSQFLKK